MRSNRSSSSFSYVAVAVTILAIVALFVYMWKDSQKQEKPLPEKAKPAQKVNESSAVLNQNPNSDQQSQTRPAGGMRPPRRNRPERPEVSKNDGQTDTNSTANARSGTKTSDDWMFEKAENLEGRSKNETQTPSE